MPLAVAGLQGAAQVDTSKNPVLAPLWKSVTSYNQTGGLGRVAAQSRRFAEFERTGTLPKDMGPTQRDRALALQDIMRHAAGFLTCKPPSVVHQTRKARWDAIAGLMADVNREAAQIGVKLVDSPRDFRAIRMKEGEVQNPSVWLEVIDPKHRDFGMLSTQYAKWKSDPKARENRTSFWAYIGDKGCDDIVRYNKSAESFVEKNKAGHFTEFHGDTLDTTQSTSLHSSKGWGIFAITTDNRLHVGAHSDEYGDNVRHTTLTDGDPIIAAGEICIVSGKIVAISNLTGHYKLGGKQFIDWVAATDWLGPDVMVKTRFNVHGILKEKDASAPNGEVEKKSVQHAVAAAPAGKIKKWVREENKDIKNLPFSTDTAEITAAVNQVEWGDLKDIGLDEITKVAV